MKHYIEQFYNDGLGAIFCFKPTEYINKKIKNKNISKFLCIVIKLLYTILVLVFAWYIFWVKYPL